MQNALIAIGAIVIVGFGAYLLMGQDANDDMAYTPEETTVDSMEMTDETNGTPEMPAEEMDIVETAIANEDFNTLVAAVAVADLAEVLQGEGPFTVFAPVDSAFAALPDGTLDDLLLPENQDQLAGILTYHVIPGEVRSTDLSDGMMAETVNGAEVTIGVGETGVTVNNANVVTADIETSNGIIHVVDSVLLPPTE